MKTKIVVKLAVEGVHCWVNCDLKQVSYLQNEHRHTFNIKATKEVAHNDRDIEIIMFKNSLREFFAPFWNENKKLYDFKGRSCEDIATMLLKEFDLFSCEVLEDNENGAEVTRE